MVQAITFKGDGTAHFRSNYVKTSGYVREQTEKKMLFRGMMGSNPPTGFLGSYQYVFVSTMKSREKLILTIFQVKNPSNTNVYYWGGKLLSCWESGLPYELDPRTLETKGKATLDNVLNSSKCLAAHFRIDSQNNRLVTVSLTLSYLTKKTQLYIYEFDKDFKLDFQQVHEIPQFFYCHDLLLTENYYIIHHTPFYSLTDNHMLKDIAIGKKSPGDCLFFRPDVPSGMYLIPRDPNSGVPVRFWSGEPCHIYHHCMFECDDGSTYEGWLWC
eukprot:TRINITY_DN5817_c0_g1_i12.p1 TRINITY_DN5817_c0_g1~~TRINITY_DN5817_c0_g1_i12.p1  ORF type:complete len:271 (-),score=33.81 TRINITY_DN5817_c0_g1_i12:79-891(-)